MLKRSWVEINLNTIKENYRIYKAHIGSKQDIIAVVKADAYGHGQEQVAFALWECGCRNFAVSNIDEAIKLRQSGIDGSILVLGYTPVSEVVRLKEYDITQAILSEDYAGYLCNSGVKAQFAIDTGMNRIGLNAMEPVYCIRIIEKYINHININGVFTHLCVADSVENEYTHIQIDKFKQIVQKLEHFNLPYIHCMNSAGGIWQEPYGNYVRLGIMLYGLKPSNDSVLPKGIRPALEWKSVVSMVKNVKKGESIGYGRSYVAQNNMKVATIPTGYADGYNRLLSNKGFVLINGKKAPIVGRICMDQMMVDITDIPTVEFEDEVILLNEEYSADDMALLVDTIGYEIVCNIGKRVSRVYVN